MDAVEAQVIQQPGHILDYVHAVLPVLDRLVALTVAAGVDGDATTRYPASTSAVAIGCHC